MVYTLRSNTDEVLMRNEYYSKIMLKVILQEKLIWDLVKSVEP